MLPGGSPCTPRACTTLVPTSQLKKWSLRGHHTASGKSWWLGGLSAGLQGVGRGNGWGPPIEVQVRRCSPQNPRPPVALVGIRLSQIPTRHLGPYPQAPAPPGLGCCPLLQDPSQSDSPHPDLSPACRALVWLLHCTLHFLSHGLKQGSAGGDVLGRAGVKVKAGFYPAQLPDVLHILLPILTPIGTNCGHIYAYLGY